MIVQLKTASAVEKEREDTLRKAAMERIFQLNGTSDKVEVGGLCRSGMTFKDQAFHFISFSSKLKETDLTMTQADNVDFYSANFYCANLTGSTFIHCSFRRADFRGTILQDCTFMGCDFTDALFSPTELNGVTFEECTF